MVVIYLAMLAVQGNDFDLDSAISSCNEQSFVTAALQEQRGISDDFRMLLDELKPLLEKRSELAEREVEAATAGPLKGVLNTKYNRSLIADEREALDRLISSTQSKRTLIDLRNQSLKLSIERYKLNCPARENNAPDN
jgi:hypothetical protein